MPLILAELDPWHLSGHFVSKHTLRLSDMLCQENFHFFAVIGVDLRFLLKWFTPLDSIHDWSITRHLWQNIFVRKVGHIRFFVDGRQLRHTVLLSGRLRLNIGDIIIA